MWMYICNSTYTLLVSSYFMYYGVLLCFNIGHMYHKIVFQQKRWQRRCLRCVCKTWQAGCWVADAVRGTKHTAHCSLLITTYFCIHNLKLHQKNILFATPFSHHVFRLRWASSVTSTRHLPVGVWHFRWWEEITEAHKMSFTSVKPITSDWFFRS